MPENLQPDCLQVSWIGVWRPRLFRIAAFRPSCRGFCLVGRARLSCLSCCGSASGAPDCFNLQPSGRCAEGLLVFRGGDVALARYCYLSSLLCGALGTREFSVALSSCAELLLAAYSSRVCVPPFPAACGGAGCHSGAPSLVAPCSLAGCLGCVPAGFWVMSYVRPFCLQVPSQASFVCLGGLLKRRVFASPFPTACGGAGCRRRGPLRRSLPGSKFFSFSVALLGWALVVGAPASWPCGPRAVCSLVGLALQLPSSCTAFGRLSSRMSHSGCPEFVLGGW